MEPKRFPADDAVNYEDFRADIRTGDLLFCSGNYWGSRLTRWVTSSPWSHVAMVVNLKEINRVVVLESVERHGVRVFPLSRYLDDYKNGKAYNGGIVIARHDKFSGLSDDKRIKVFSRSAVDRFGYPYDYCAIFRILLRIATRSVGEKYVKVLKRNWEFICSEYVEECYRDVGIKFGAHPGGWIAPADIANDLDVQLQWVLKR